MSRCMKILFKTRYAEIIVTAKTNRKTCQVCNGSGQYDTCEGKDDCDYCGGSGDFISMFVHDTYSNYEKYFSKDDIEKIDMIKKLHEFTFYRDVYAHSSLSDQQAKNIKYPEEENLIVRKIQ